MIVKVGIFPSSCLHCNPSSSSSRCPLVCLPACLPHPLLSLLLLLLPPPPAAFIPARDPTGADGERSRQSREIRSGNKYLRNARLLLYRNTTHSWTHVSLRACIYGEQRDPTLTSEKVFWICCCLFSLNEEKPNWLPLDILPEW